MSTSWFSKRRTVGLCIQHYFSPYRAIHDLPGAYEDPPLREN